MLQKFLPLIMLNLRQPEDLAVTKQIYPELMDHNRHAVGTYGMAGFLRKLTILLASLLRANQQELISDGGWKFLTEEYVPRFGFNSNTWLIQMAFDLYRVQTVKDESLQIYHPEQMGLSAAGRAGLNQLAAMYQADRQELYSRRQIDPKKISSPLYCAMAAYETGFSTATWGHGSHYHLDFKNYVSKHMQQDHLTRGLAVTLGQQYPLSRKGNDAFDKDSQKKGVLHASFSRYWLPLAADLGNACYSWIIYFEDKKSVLGTVVYTEGEGREEHFSGSTLILENRIKGKKTWILRAVNPSTELCETYHDQDIFRAVLDYTVKLAEKYNLENPGEAVEVLVAPFDKSLPESFSRRPAMVKTLQQWFGTARDVTLDQKEKFNKMDITNSCRVIAERGQDGHFIYSQEAFNRQGIKHSAATMTATKVLRSHALAGPAAWLVRHWGAWGIALVEEFGLGTGNSQINKDKFAQLRAQVLTPWQALQRGRWLPAVMVGLTYAFWMQLDFGVYILVPLAIVMAGWPAKGQWAFVTGHDQGTRQQWAARIMAMLFFNLISLSLSTTLLTILLSFNPGGIPFVLMAVFASSMAGTLTATMGHIKWNSRASIKNLITKAGRLNWRTLLLWSSTVLIILLVATMVLPYNGMDQAMLLKPGNMGGQSLWGGMLPAGPGMSAMPPTAEEFLVMSLLQAGVAGLFFAVISYFLFKWLDRNEDPQKKGEIDESLKKTLINEVTRIAKQYRGQEVAIVPFLQGFMKRNYKNTMATPEQLLSVQDQLIKEHIITSKSASIQQLGTGEQDEQQAARLEKRVQGWLFLFLLVLFFHITVDYNPPLLILSTMYHMSIAMLYLGLLAAFVYDDARQAVLRNEFNGWHELFISGVSYLMGRRSAGTRAALMSAVDDQSLPVKTGKNNNSTWQRWWPWLLIGGAGMLGLWIWLSQDSSAGQALGLAPLGDQPKGWLGLAAGLAMVAGMIVAAGLSLFWLIKWLSQRPWWQDWLQRLGSSLHALTEHMLPKPAKNDSSQKSREVEQTREKQRRQRVMLWIGFGLLIVIILMSLNLNSGEGPLNLSMLKPLVNDKILTARLGLPVGIGALAVGAAKTLSSPPGLSEDQIRIQRQVMETVWMPSLSARGSAAENAPKHAARSVQEQAYGDLIDRLAEKDLVTMAGGQAAFVALVNLFTPAQIDQALKSGTIESLTEYIDYYAGKRFAQLESKTYYSLPFTEIPNQLNQGQWLILVHNKPHTTRIGREETWEDFASAPLKSGSGAVFHYTFVPPRVFTDKGLYEFTYYFSDEQRWEHNLWEPNHKVNVYQSEDPVSMNIEDVAPVIKKEKPNSDVLVDEILGNLHPAEVKHSIKSALNGHSPDEQLAILNIMLGLGNGNPETEELSSALHRVWSKYYGQEQEVARPVITSINLPPDFESVKKVIYSPYGHMLMLYKSSDYSVTGKLAIYPYDEQGLKDHYLIYPMGKTITDIALSNDHDWLAISSIANGNNNKYSLSLAPFLKEQGGVYAAAKVIDESADDILGMAWSPKEPLLAVGQKGKGQFYKQVNQRWITMDGPVRQEATFGFKFPQWSLQGDKVLFCNDDKNDFGPVAVLWYLNDDHPFGSSDHTALLLEPKHTIDKYTQFRFSPDGVYLAAMQNSIIGKPALYIWSIGRQRGAIQGQGKALQNEIKARGYECQHDLLDLRWTIDNALVVIGIRYPKLFSRTKTSVFAAQAVIWQWDDQGEEGLSTYPLATVIGDWEKEILGKIMPNGRIIMLNRSHMVAGSSKWTSFDSGYHVTYQIPNITYSEWKKVSALPSGKAFWLTGEFRQAQPSWFKRRLISLSLPEEMPVNEQSEKAAVPASVKTINDLKLAQGLNQVVLVTDNAIGTALDAVMDVYHEDEQSPQLINLGPADSIEGWSGWDEIKRTYRDDAVELPLWRALQRKQPIIIRLNRGVKQNVVEDLLQTIIPYLIKQKRFHSMVVIAPPEVMSAVATTIENIHAWIRGAASPEQRRAVTTMPEVWSYYPMVHAAPGSLAEQQERLLRLVDELEIPQDHPARSMVEALTTIARLSAAYAADHSSGQELEMVPYEALAQTLIYLNRYPGEYRHVVDLVRQYTGKNAPQADGFWKTCKQSVPALGMDEKYIEPRDFNPNNLPLIGAITEPVAHLHRLWQLGRSAILVNHNTMDLAGVIADYYRQTLEEPLWIDGAGIKKGEEIKEVDQLTAAYDQFRPVIINHIHQMDPYILTHVHYLMTLSSQAYGEEGFRPGFQIVGIDEANSAYAPSTGTAVIPVEEMDDADLKALIQSAAPHLKTAQVKDILNLFNRPVYQRERKKTTLFPGLKLLQLLAEIADWPEPMANFVIGHSNSILELIAQLEKFEALKLKFSFKNYWDYPDLGEQLLKGCQDNSQLYNSLRSLQLGLSYYTLDQIAAYVEKMHDVPLPLLKESGSEQSIFTDLPGIREQSERAAMLNEVFPTLKRASRHHPPLYSFILNMYLEKKRPEEQQQMLAAMKNEQWLTTVELLAKAIALTNKQWRDVFNHYINAYLDGQATHVTAVVKAFSRQAVLILNSGLLSGLDAQAWQYTFDALLYWQAEHPDNLKVLLNIIDVDENENVVFKSFDQKSKQGWINLAREIINSRITSYVNILEDCLFTAESLNPYYRPFPQTIWSGYLDLRSRMAVAELYAEIAMADEYLKAQWARPATEEESEQVEETGQHEETGEETFYQLVGELNNLLKAIKDQATTASRRRKLIEAMAEKQNMVRKLFLHTLLNAHNGEYSQALDKLDPGMKKRVMTIAILLETLDNGSEVSEYGEAGWVRLMNKHVFKIIFDHLMTDEQDALRKGLDAAQRFLLDFDRAAMQEELKKLDELEAQLGKKGTGYQTDDLSEHKANKETIVALVAAGYDERLWTEGIELKVGIDQALSEEQKVQRILSMSHELAEWAIELGMTTFNGKPFDLSRAHELIDLKTCKALVNELGAQVPVISEDIDARINDILDHISNTEKKEAEVVAKQQFRVVIKKDFIREATAGIGVPGCFEPKRGLHREMPLVHAMEGDVFFIQIFDERNRQVSNAVMVTTPEGAHVFGGYNGTNYDLEKAYGKAILKATALIPRFILNPTSAGYHYFHENKVGKELKEPVTLVKSFPLFMGQYFDYGKVYDGQLKLEISIGLEVTKADAQQFNSTSEGNTQVLAALLAPGILFSGQQVDWQDAGLIVAVGLGLFWLFKWLFRQPWVKNGLDQMADQLKNLNAVRLTMPVKIKSSKRSSDEEHAKEQQWRKVVLSLLVFGVLGIISLILMHLHPGEGSLNLLRTHHLGNNQNLGTVLSLPLGFAMIKNKRALDKREALYGTSLTEPAQPLLQLIRLPRVIYMALLWSLFWLMELMRPSSGKKAITPQAWAQWQTMKQRYFPAGTLDAASFNLRQLSSSVYTGHGAQACLGQYEESTDHSGLAQLNLHPAILEALPLPAAPTLRAVWQHRLAQALARHILYYRSAEYHELTLSQQWRFTMSQWWGRVDRAAYAQKMESGRTGMGNLLTRPENRLWFLTAGKQQQVQLLRAAVQWLESNPMDPHNLDVLIQVMNRLPASSRLYLGDWARNQSPLGDRAVVRVYIPKIIEQEHLPMMRRLMHLLKSSGRFDQRRPRRRPRQRLQQMAQAA